MKARSQLARVAIGAALAALVSTPALARDARTASVLYVADSVNNGVYLFNAENFNAPMIGAITSGIAQPSSIAIDNKGVLYVANAGSGEITIYKSGATSPYRMIAASKRGTPVALAVGSDNTLVVGYDGAAGRNATLMVFDKGSSQATRSIAISQEANTEVSIGSVAVESGSIYASVMRSPNGPSDILKFAPGSSKGVNTTIASGTGEAFDAEGNFYVDSGAAVAVYSPGQSQARYFVSGLVNAGQIAVEPDGTLFIPLGQYKICSQLTEPGYIAEYAPGSQNASAYLESNSLQNPVSLALLYTK